MDLLKKHILFLKYNSNIFPDINIKFKKEFVSNNNEFENLLSTYKNEINKIKNKQKWDYTKKLTNKFEMIYVNDYLYSSSIANIKPKPISRAYFKLWEIIKDLNVIDFSKKRIVIVGLAEGPGGFIECIYNMRKKYSKNYKDKCVCITLKSYRNKIPGWKSAIELFSNNPTIEIYDGVHKNGNLYKRYNIEGLSDYIGEDKADIVTGDGGFDFSIDYDKQEQLSYRIIFCQIVASLGVLKNGGHFILKVFDLYSYLSVKIIYFLTTLFIDGVYIMKPFTSRPANSEKYIICKHFKGIRELDLTKLYNMVDDWEILDSQNKYVYDIFDINIPNMFEKSIETYNIYILHKQIKNILKTLTYIHINMDNKQINKIKQEQCIKAILWCKKYDIPINNYSKYLSKDIHHCNYLP